MKQENTLIRTPKHAFCRSGQSQWTATSAHLYQQIQQQLEQLSLLLAQLPTGSPLLSAPHPGALSATLQSSQMAPTDTCGWLSYGFQLADSYAHQGRYSAADKLRTSLRSFARFLPTDDMPLQSLDAHTLQQYDQYLKAQGCTPNTRSFYLRTLRAAYNTAVQQGLTPQHHPFQHTFTGRAKTPKRALTYKELALIKRKNWSHQPEWAQAQALFLLCFYLRGISFIDLAYLRKTDLRNGFVQYRRHKTGQLLTIRWEPEMQKQLQLLWKLSESNETNSPYLLPILNGTDTDAAHLRRLYTNAVHLLNKRLRRMGQELGLPLVLTSYVVRHTWASLAKQRNVPLPVISESLGHDNQRTTQIYLAELEQDVLDEANRKVWEGL